MADKYPSLAALKAALKDQIDYRSRLLDRKSRVTIMAPHGGFIEAGTSALARSVAGSRYNLFDFQGLKAEAGADLHVTSTRFRDPDLSCLLRRSCVAVSIHSMGPANESVVWLGGRNKTLKQLVLEHLQKAAFAVNPDSPLYRGESPKNVVNLALHEGVQLELSDELVAELFVGPGFRTDSIALKRSARYAAFTCALQAAISDFERMHKCQTMANLAS
jgi:phage replication-related protein YjqB (UPF0714/DUF867 family)